MLVLKPLYSILKIEMEIAILFDKTSDSLKRDADILANALKKVAAGQIRLRYVDPLEPPVSVDLCIHLDTPIYVWMPWSTVSVLLVNPERYEAEEWSGYVPHFDGFLFKSKGAQERFQTANPTAKTWFMPWTAPKESFMTKAPRSTQRDGFVAFVETEGQLNYTKAVMQLWKESYPYLHLYVKPGLKLEVPEHPSIVLKEYPKDEDARRKLLVSYPGALCLTEEDTFNYRAAEAEMNGLYILMNQSDTNRQDFSESQWVSKYDQESLDKAMDAFEKTDLNISIREQIRRGKERLTHFLEKSFPGLWAELKDIVVEKKPLKAKHLPPVLQPADCPSISIVTLLYNRRKFFDLACHNIMLSDYPKAKIEWVIVEDSDDPNEDASDRVVQVGLKSAPLTVVYIPLEKKTPIGQKRNIGIERAKNDIILFMDDDDHYPETSFRRRVSWLTKHPWGPKAVGCTTIACYDLIRGVSSVNTPPWNLSLGKRISEATLTFYKSWWAEKKFPADAGISEGEGFLEGREQDVLELPPQQVIVAFSHSKNTSGRRVPSGDIKPGCFWGFPKEYLIYIHRIVGMEIEEER